MIRTTSLMCAAIVAALIPGMLLNANAGDGKQSSERVSILPAEPGRNPGDLTSRKKITFAEAGDVPLRFFDNSAELEATRVEFLVDFHFGVDQWINHRVEAEITNIDTAWSGSQRKWEIYSFPPGGYHWGIYLVDEGTVPPLAPGETFKFTRSLPSTVNFDATYALILSPGDADSSNDIAIDEP